MTAHLGDCDFRTCRGHDRLIYHRVDWPRWKWKHVEGITMLNELGRRAYEIAEEAGWHAQRTDEEGNLRQSSTIERLALVHDEVSEATECLRCPSMGLIWFEPDGKPEGLAAELADIIIRTVEIAHIHEIDLDMVIECKMEYNRRRMDVPLRLGTKVL